MAEQVLIDTGPLYAILDKRDEHHSRCVETLRSLRGRLVTCWPVLTETAWFLRDDPRALTALFHFFGKGRSTLATVGEEALDWIAELVRRYQNLPAQAADATLVYIAERDGIDTVFTLDRRDFTVFRLRSGRALRLLPELR